MILRLVRGRLLPGRVATVRAGLAASLDQVRALEGLVHVYVGLRSAAGTDRLAVISTWVSAEAAVTAFGPDAQRVAVISGVTEHLEIESVSHFELDESAQLEGDEPAAVLRVAVGEIELGSDVEIQQELRRRLTTLGEDVVEAYVGRRIRDQMVEVVFVTVWSRPPSAGSLEQSLFPDIAERYDAYWIEVYEEIYHA